MNDNPDRVMVAEDGRVILEWQTKDKNYEIEVEPDGMAELQIHTIGAMSGDQFISGSLGELINKVRSI